MTHFRFYYRCVGFLRRRCRGARRPTVLPIIPVALARAKRPSAAAWRRTLALAAAVPAPSAATYRVGAFVVGEDGDPKLHGHPDICY